MTISHSPLESDRFGLRILRSTATEVNPAKLLRAITAEQVDVMILRIPTSEQYRLSELSVLPFPVVVADTVVTFECDLRSFPAQPLRNPRLVARQATAADQPILDELVGLTFKSYRSHYHSNPLFDPQLVLAGYKEWVNSYLTSNGEQTCFLFYLDERAIAYTTIALREKYGEGAVFGARPDASSPGLYGDLIRHSKQYLLDHGRKKAHATTQVQNHGVQRLWVREGFIPARSFTTIHINAMLRHGASSAAASVAVPM